MPFSLPAFASLPLNKGDPPYSAWGLYGPDDELGTLNRLTNAVVVEAAKEIQTGVRVSLDEALDFQGHLTFFKRQPFEKEIIEKKPRCVNDDRWIFNTQSSSQWDGLRHFAYQNERRFYNGKTMDDIHGPNKSNVLGIQAMEKRGIVGRGVLLDYESWRLANGIVHESHFATGAITLEHLQACARDQGVEFKFGDILFIRSGYSVAWRAKTEKELAELAQVFPPNLIGVEQTPAMMEWIWNNFAAVAGDQPSFEQWPPQSQPPLHEVLLAGWGCPIGEMFALEELAETCKALGRWSFFVSSKVNHVPGGVASPPNILAIF